MAHINIYKRHHYAFCAPIVTVFEISTFQIDVIRWGNIILMYLGVSSNRFEILNISHFVHLENSCHSSLNCPFVNSMLRDLDIRFQRQTSANVPDRFASTRTPPPPVYLDLFFTAVSRVAKQIGQCIIYS